MLPKLNMLFSYGVIGRHKSFMDVIQGIGDYTNIMIDSGAFSNRSIHIKHIKYDSSLDKVVTLDEYVDFLKLAHNKIWGYINLDVMGEPIPTRENYDALLNKGFHPIPVITQGVTREEVEEIIGTSDRVGIASGLKAAPPVISFVNSISGGKTRMHLLGYSEYPQVTQIPIRYCDSSSFMAGGRYGSLCIFNKSIGIKAHSLRRSSRRGAIPIDVLNELERCNVSMDDFGDKVFGTGISSPTCLSSINAYVELHKAINDKVAYFFSISTLGWLNAVLAIVNAKADGSAFDYQVARDEYNRLQSFSKTSVNSYVDEMVAILKKNTDHTAVLN